MRIHLTHKRTLALIFTLAFVSNGSTNDLKIESICGEKFSDDLYDASLIVGKNDSTDSLSLTSFASDLMRSFDHNSDIDSTSDFLQSLFSSFVRVDLSEKELNYISHPINEQLFRYDRSQSAMDLGDGVLQTLSDSSLKSPLVFTALVNRFDLAKRSDYQTCGEIRLIYNVRSGFDKGKFSLIFESSIPNTVAEYRGQTGRPDDCKPLLEKWKEISSTCSEYLTSEKNHADARRFYSSLSENIRNILFEKTLHPLTGIWIPPAVEWKNFGQNGFGNGQVRAGYQLEKDTWTFKQWRIRQLTERGSPIFTPSPVSRTISLDFFSKPSSGEEEHETDKSTNTADLTHDKRVVRGLKQQLTTHVKQQIFYNLLGPENSHLNENHSIQIPEFRYYFDRISLDPLLRYSQMQGTSEQGVSATDMFHPSPRRLLHFMESIKHENLFEPPVNGGARRFFLNSGVDQHIWNNFYRKIIVYRLKSQTCSGCHSSSSSNTVGLVDIGKLTPAFQYDEKNRDKLNATNLSEVNWPHEVEIADPEHGFTDDDSPECSDATSFQHINGSGARSCFFDYVVLPKRRDLFSLYTQVISKLGQQFRDFSAPKIYQHAHQFAASDPAYKSNPDCTSLSAVVSDLCVSNLKENPSKFVLSNDRKGLYTDYLPAH